MSRRRIDALIALSNDPAATEHERALAAQRLAEIRASSPAGSVIEDHTEVEVDDSLIAAFDRAMDQASDVRSSRHRAARIRAAEVRLGREAAKQWRDGRGPALRR